MYICTNIVQRFVYISTSLDNIYICSCVYIVQDFAKFLSLFLFFIFCLFFAQTIQLLTNYQEQIQQTTTNDTIVSQLNDRVSVREWDRWTHRYVRIHIQTHKHSYCLNIKGNFVYNNTRVTNKHYITWCLYCIVVRHTWYMIQCTLDNCNCISKHAENHSIASKVKLYITFRYIHCTLVLQKIGTQTEHCHWSSFESVDILFCPLNKYEPTSLAQRTVGGSRKKLKEIRLKTTMFRYFREVSIA